MSNPIIVALDVPSVEKALALAEQVAPAVGAFKIGSELFTSGGPDIVRRIRATGASVFLDLKFHDIPNTVAKSVAAAEWACANSGWGCWSFLGTLAAAFARENDFERAVAWQRVSLQLTPEPQRHCAEFELGEFERGRPYIDNKRKVSAGAEITDEELSQLNVRDLLLKANELITAARTVIH